MVSKTYGLPPGSLHENDGNHGNNENNGNHENDNKKTRTTQTSTNKRVPGACLTPLVLTPW